MKIVQITEEMVDHFIVSLERSGEVYARLHISKYSNDLTIKVGETGRTYKVRSKDYLGPKPLREWHYEVLDRFKAQEHLKQFLRCLVAKLGLPIEEINKSKDSDHFHFAAATEELCICLGAALDGYFAGIECVRSGDNDEIQTGLPGFKELL